MSEEKLPIEDGAKASIPNTTKQEATIPSEENTNKANKYDNEVIEETS